MPSSDAAREAGIVGAHGAGADQHRVDDAAQPVRADDPRLTCRIAGGHDPQRIVLAGRELALPARARVLARGGPPTLVIAPAGARADRVASLRRRGVEVELLPGRHGRVPFGRVVRALGARGLTTLLVEGGGTVAAEALRAGVVDRVILFLAPSFLGADGVPAIGPLDIRRAANAIRLGPPVVQRIGDDLVLESRPRARRRNAAPFASQQGAR